MKLNKMEKKKEKYGYMFLLPWFIMYIIFFAYPFFYGIIVSFTDYSLSGMNFVGINNYLQIFDDYTFVRSLIATLLYCVLIIPFRVFIPLWAANVLRRMSKKANTWIKMLIYLPGVTNTVALVLAWEMFFFPNTGILNQWFLQIGLNRFSLFDTALTAIPTISLLVILCSLGSNLIIFSAALNNISKEYYEAAALDGATESQIFYKITIPLLKPTILYSLITTTIATLQIFVIPQLMTGGGPNYSTSSLLMLIYSSAFTKNQFGYASALGVILFIINAGIAIVQYRLMKKGTDIN